MPTLIKGSQCLLEKMGYVLVDEFMQRNGVSDKQRSYFAKYILSQTDCPSTAPYSRQSSQLTIPSGSYKLAFNFWNTEGKCTS